MASSVIGPLPRCCGSRRPGAARPHRPSTASLASACQAHRRRLGNAELAEAVVGQHVGARPLERDAATVDDDDAVREAGEEIGLLLDDTDARAGLGDRRQRVSDEARAGRVELRGGLVEDEVPRPQREQAGDRDQLLLPARKPRRVALGECLDPQGCQRVPAAGDHLVTWHAKVHRTNATSSKTRLGHAGQLGRGVLEVRSRPARPPRASPAPPGPRRPAAPFRAACPDRPRRKPRGHQGERRLARLGRRRRFRPPPRRAARATRRAATRAARRRTDS